MINFIKCLSYIWRFLKLKKLTVWRVDPLFFLLEWIDNRFQFDSCNTLFDVICIFWQKCCCVGGLPFFITRSFKICYQFIIAFMMLNNNWYLLVDFMLWISNLLMPYFLIKMFSFCLFFSFSFFFFLFWGILMSFCNWNSHWRMLFMLYILFYF